MEKTFHPLAVLWNIEISLHQRRAWSHSTVNLTQWLIFTEKRALPSFPLFLSSLPSPTLQPQLCSDPCMSWLSFFAGLVFCQVCEFSHFSKDQENRRSHKETSRNTAGSREKRKLGGWRDKDYLLSPAVIIRLAQLCDPKVLQNNLLFRKLSDSTGVVILLYHFRESIIMLDRIFIC